MEGTKTLKFFVTVVCMVAVAGAIPIGDLLDLASQHSDKLHSLSTLLTHELDTHFPPIGHKIMPRPSMCHTATLQGPTDKIQALQFPEHDLLSLVRSLLQSWADPLLVLSANANTLPHPAQSTIASKVQELRDNSNSLGHGLDILSGKMGPASQILSISPYDGNADLGEDNISKLLNFQFLLSCFRRDSHKIDSFLKVLRCRAAKMQPNMC
uniref:Prolactin n=1 Tax=Neogobius melanostomus TaxID=47308 RepID=A0A8C6V3X3_9GOBI